MFSQLKHLGVFFNPTLKFNKCAAKGNSLLGVIKITFTEIDKDIHVHVHVYNHMSGIRGLCLVSLAEKWTLKFWSKSSTELRN